MIKFEEIIGNIILEHDWECQQIPDHLLQSLNTGKLRKTNEFNDIKSIISGSKILEKKSHIWKTICLDKNIYMIDCVHQKFAGNTNDC